MYDIVGEFEEKGRQKAAAEALGIMSNRLISTLEQRFPDFPDNLKDRIKKVTDANKMFDLIACVALAKSPEEIARQLKV